MRGTFRSPVVPAPRSSRGRQRCATSIAVAGVERRSRAAAARSASIAARVPTDGTAERRPRGTQLPRGRIRQRAQHDARSLHEIGHERVPLAGGDQREQRGRRLHLPVAVVAEPRRGGERLGVELGQPRERDGRRGARPSAALGAGRSPPAPGRPAPLEETQTPTSARESRSAAAASVSSSSSSAPGRRRRSTRRARGTTAAVATGQAAIRRRFTCSRLEGDQPDPRTVHGGHDARPRARGADGRPR